MHGNPMAETLSDFLVVVSLIFHIFVSFQKL